MIVLDTNIVSEMMRVRPAGVVEIWLGDLTPDETALTVIGVHELRYGIKRLVESREKRRLASMLETILTGTVGRILDLDARSAERAADIRIQRQLAGRPIELADALVAGIAAANGAALATRNVKDFSGTGLSLIDPWAESGP